MTSVAILSTSRATDRVRTHAPAWVPGAVALGALGYAVVAQGAFYAGPRRAFTLALLVAGGSALVRGAVGSPRSRWWVLPGALAAWALWCGAVASNLAGGAEWAALLLGLTGVARMAASATDAERDRLVTGLLLASVFVAGTGWYGVVARREPLGLVDGGLWRAASTLTYANATAAFLAPIALLALGRLSRDRTDRIAALAAFAGFVGIGASQSRAGILGLAAGAVAFGLVRGLRATVSAVWPVSAGAAVAVAGLLPSTMG
ncbi:MAG: hypothetical protein U0V73_04995 [Acidimicrobiia bacterium]